MVALNDKLPIAEVARRLDLPVKTVRQWGTRGLKAPGTGRVRLRTFRLGRPVYTTSQWLDEFLNVLNPTKGPTAA